MPADALGEEAFLGHEIVAIDHQVILLTRPFRGPVRASGLYRRERERKGTGKFFASYIEPLKSGGKSKTGIRVFLINSTGTFPASKRAKTFFPVRPSTITDTSRSTAVLSTARAMSSLNM